MALVSTFHPHCKFVMESSSWHWCLLKCSVYVILRWTPPISSPSLRCSSVRWTYSICLLMCVSFSYRFLWLHKQVSWKLNIQLFVHFFPVGELSLVSRVCKVHDRGSHLYHHSHSTSCRLIYFVRYSGSQDVSQHQGTTEDAGCALVVKGTFNFWGGGGDGRRHKS